MFSSPDKQTIKPIWYYILQLHVHFTDQFQEHSLKNYLYLLYPVSLPSFSPKPNVIRLLPHHSTLKTVSTKSPVITRLLSAKCILSTHSSQCIAYWIQLSSPSVTSFAWLPAYHTFLVFPLPHWLLFLRLPCLFLLMVTTSKCWGTPTLFSI